MSKIIAFGHKKRTGKDTAANALYNDLRRTLGPSKVKKIAFADPLYDICLTMYGWAGFRPKEEYDLEIADKSLILEPVGLTPRNILIKIGMLMRSMRESIWVDLALNQKDADIIIISDMRFPNEFQAVKDAGGLCIKITRPKIPLTPDIADCALDDEIRWDAEVVNDGSIKRLCYETYKSVKDYLNLPRNYAI